VYLELIWSFFQIGLFSFGGGYAALPLIQQQVVAIHGWLTLQEFTDVLTISQMTPGPIAINAASFVGTRVGGILGAIAATFGTVLPAIFIILALAWFYYRYNSLSVMQGALSGLRPAVVALIGSAGLAILLTVLFGSPALPESFDGVSIYAVLMFFVGMVLLRMHKLHPILLIVGFGGITMVLGMFFDFVSV
jgi:chromate transporter